MGLLLHQVSSLERPLQSRDRTGLIEQVIFKSSLSHCWEWKAEEDLQQHFSKSVSQIYDALHGKFPYIHERVNILEQ